MKLIIWNPKHNFKDTAYSTLFTHGNISKMNYDACCNTLFVYIR